MKRIIIGVLLIFVLLSLCTYHWLYNDVHQDYPETEDVIMDANRFVGSKISVYGVFNGEGLVISHGGDSKVLEVQSLSEVERGDRVEVLGLLEDESTVDAEKVIIYPKWTYYSIFIRSVVAIPLVLLVFFRNWSFSSEFRFRRR